MMAFALTVAVNIVCAVQYYWNCDDMRLSFKTIHQVKQPFRLKDFFERLLVQCFQLKHYDIVRLRRFCRKPLETNFSLILMILRNSNIKNHMIKSFITKKSLEFVRRKWIVHSFRGVTSRKFSNCVIYNHKTASFWKPVNIYNLYLLKCTKWSYRNQRNRPLKISVLPNKPSTINPFSLCLFV